MARRGDRKPDTVEDRPGTASLPQDPAGPSLFRDQTSYRRVTGQESTGAEYRIRPRGWLVDQKLKVRFVYTERPGPGTAIPQGIPFMLMVLP